MFLNYEKCALCGEKNEVIMLGSSNTFGGSPDLDTRPAEMLRSTINVWIHICSSCGFCAPDISKRIEKSSELVRTDLYQQQLNSTEFPKLANAFLCYSLIQENAGDYAGAGWSCVHASWVCDDTNSEEAAQKCRKKAIGLFQKAKENSQVIDEEASTAEILIIDLLRRSRQFELALKTCDENLKKNPEKSILDVLKYEKILIKNKDSACHTIEEATKRTKSQSKAGEKA